MRSRLALAALLVLASSAAHATIDTTPTAVPPPDPAVLQGVLPNGMHYYVRRNEKPEKRIELRLAVKVGSVQETDAERGIAHLNEHMNFNGSKNFKPGEVVSYLESIGSRFGADSNAYTSYDETVYQLQIPTDKPGAVDKGLTIMADWAGRATLDPVEIEKERGVVIDELRRGKGAGKRIRDKQDQITFRGSKYADRATIGLEDVIKNARPEVVKGFYTKWYHPDVMAIVAVGDFDAKQMEQQVKDLFGALPKGDAPLDIPKFPVPPHDETLYSVESDKELPNSVVSIRYEHEPEPDHTVADQRRELVRGLTSALLSLRLQERTLKPDAPFLGAGGGAGHYVRTLDVFNVSARAKDGGIPKAAAALAEEIARARDFGFVPAELERVKSIVLQSLESQHAEAAKARSEERIGGIVDSFLEDTPLTSDDYDYELGKALVPTITIDEINATFRSLSEPKSRVVLVQAPDKEGAVPSVDELKAAIEPVGGVHAVAYVDDMAGKTLVNSTPGLGTVVSRRKFPEVGAEELNLSNGLRVVIKTTDYRSDEILMRAYARGGTSSLPEKDFLVASHAAGVSDSSGLADFTLPQLQKYLAGAGKLAGASPGTRWFTRTFSGNARPADLETMLQMVNLYFTRPAFRAEALQQDKDSTLEWLKNRLSTPGGMYQQAIDETVTGNNRLLRVPTVDEVKALQLADIERVYRAMFDDASEWTFFLVGNVDEDKHLPLVLTWLGSLPSSSKTPKDVDQAAEWKALNLRFPETHQHREVVKGVEDQSRTLFAMSAPYGLDPQTEFDIDAAADLLEIRLREKLREDKGETYSVSTGISNYAPDPDYGSVTVSFSSAPDTREGMMKDVKTAIGTLKTTTPTDKDVSKLKEMRLNSLDEAQKENGYWLGQLVSAYVMRRQPKTILDYRKRIGTLTARQVQAAAKRWFDVEKSAEVYLVPEAKVPPAAKPAVVPEAKEPTPS